MLLAIGIVILFQQFPLHLLQLPLEIIYLLFIGFGVQFLFQISLLLFQFFDFTVNLIGAANAAFAFGAACMKR